MTYWSARRRWTSKPAACLYMYACMRSCVSCHIMGHEPLKAPNSHHIIVSSTALRNNTALLCAFRLSINPHLYCTVHSSPPPKNPSWTLGHSKGGHTIILHLSCSPTHQWTNFQHGTNNTALHHTTNTHRALQHTRAGGDATQPASISCSPQAQHQQQRQPSYGAAASS